jgi:molybdenum cofactor synthesis domain-containing protein
MNESFARVALTAPAALTLARGQAVLAAPPAAGLPGLSCAPAACALPAGTRLTPAPGGPVLTVEARLELPGPGHAPVPALALRAGGALTLAPGTHACAAERPGLALAVIVLSDKGAAGLREDKCAPIILERAAAVLPLAHARTWVVPDDPARLRALLADLCLTQGFDLVLTSGGTGVGPRDTTPEATLAAIDRRLPGYERAMTAASLAVTPHGAISRAVAGTLGRALVVNMPGSPKAVAENLDPLLPTLVHTIMKLQGDPADCARA